MIENAAAIFLLGMFTGPIVFLAGFYLAVQTIQLVKWWRKTKPFPPPFGEESDIVRLVKLYIDSKKHGISGRVYYFKRFAVAFMRTTDKPLLTLPKVEVPKHVKVIDAD